MAFPTSPVDGQLYTNALGTQYHYVAVDTAWKIVGGPGGGTGDITGSGTAGYLAKFSDATTIGDSPFNVTGTQTMLMSTFKGAGTNDGSNVFIGGGGQSSFSNTSYLASYNTALGKNALNAITSGAGNVAVGVDALKNNLTGTSNVAVGKKALELNTTGTSNTAVGDVALVDSSGSNNVAVGHSAMRYSQNGSYNVAVGDNAGLFRLPSSTILTDATNCVYIGYNTKGGQAAPSNEIVIGANNGYTNGGGTNTTTIGNTDSTQAVIFAELLGIDTTSPKGILHPVSIDSTNHTNCITASVGPTTAFIGNFVRDSSSILVRERQDSGVLDASGWLKIVGEFEDDIANSTLYAGIGYAWMQTYGSTTVNCTGFTFHDSVVSLFQTINDCQTYDSTGLCIFGASNDTTATSKLYIKNGDTVERRIGYWVKYWPFQA